MSINIIDFNNEEIKLNNLVHLQKSILEMPTMAGSITNSVMYVIGNITDLQDLSESAQKIYYYTPEKLSRDTMKAVSMENVEILDEVRLIDFFMLSVDCHMNNKQYGFELATLRALKPSITRNNPFIFLRAEEPDQAFLLLEALDSIDYKPFFWYKMLPDGSSEVWIFAYSKKITVPDFGLHDAFDTGHPKLPKPTKSEAFELIVK